MVLLVLVFNQEAKSTPFRSNSFAGMATKFYYKVEFVRSSGVSEEVKERVKESLSRSLVGAWIEGNKKWPWHGGDLGMLVEMQMRGLERGVISCSAVISACEKGE